MTSMTGTTVLITGGSGGFGAALADTDPAGRALAESLGGIFVPADVSRPEDNDRAVETVIDRFGHLNVAVLNAGIGGRGSFLEGLDLPLPELS